jgi:hypothetical protein
MINPVCWYEADRRFIIFLGSKKDVYYIFVEREILCKKYGEIQKQIILWLIGI